MDYHTTQLGPSCPALLPHPSHALQDYPHTTAHVCSAGRYHQTVYPMAMVANRSGMSPASALQLAVHQACYLASHHTRAGSALPQEAQTWTITQPSTVACSFNTAASDSQSCSSSEEQVLVPHNGRVLPRWQTRLVQWRVRVRSVT